MVNRHEIRIPIVDILEFWCYSKINKHLQVAIILASPEFLGKKIIQTQQIIDSQHKSHHCWKEIFSHASILFSTL